LVAAEMAASFGAASCNVTAAAFVATDFGLAGRDFLIRLRLAFLGFDARSTFGIECAACTAPTGRGLLRSGVRDPGGRISTGALSSRSWADTPDVEQKPMINAVTQAVRKRLTTSSRSQFDSGTIRL
jgi:hypothetical protein